MKYVIYDKVLPAPESVFEGWEDFLNAYKWLGTYCKYCPQIWLSRSKSSITGYKNNQKFPKKRKYVIGKKPDEDYIMFGFENIIGFPVDYNFSNVVACDFLSGFANNSLLGPLKNCTYLSTTRMLTVMNAFPTTSTQI